MNLVGFSKTEPAPKPVEAKPLPVLEIKDVNPDGFLSYGNMDDVPNLDIWKCEMVNQLDMLNNSGLLDKEEMEDLKLLKREVEIERSNMEAYWKRNFNEKTSDRPRC